MEKIKILRELTRGVHMPSFCDEEGRCEALEEVEYVDANDCSFCEINHIVKAFNRGIEFQKEKSPWISVKDSLPEQDEEVIVLRDEFNTSYFYKISFAHIVDKTVCRDYNGWNVPDVVYWFPMPKIPKTGD